MVSIEEMQGRIRAACDARRDDDFVIIARTDARGAVGGSLEETIERLDAYADAGADVLMPMPNGLDEGREVARAITAKPLMWFAGLGRFAPGDEVHVNTLKELRYLIVTYPIIGLCRALAAVYELYAPLRERGIVDVDGLDEAYERIMRLIDAPFYYDLEARTTESSPVS
jgi:2-methylisocitrate lyase-like PEP mutase family enzyme